MSMASSHDASLPAHDERPGDIEREFVEGERNEGTTMVSDAVELEHQDRTAEECARGPIGRHAANCSVDGRLAGGGDG